MAVETSVASPQDAVEVESDKLDSASAEMSRKGQPWTEAEHLAFLAGLKKLGKGNWRGISRYFVSTRTPTQVASHAQKHFLRVQGVMKRKSRFTALEKEALKKGILNEGAPSSSNPSLPAASSPAAPVPAPAIVPVPMPCFMPPMFFPFQQQMMSAMFGAAGAAGMMSKQGYPGMPFMPGMPGMFGFPPFMGFPQSCQQQAGNLPPVCKPEAVLATGEATTSDLLSQLPSCKDVNNSLHPSSLSAFRVVQQPRL